MRAAFLMAHPLCVMCRKAGHVRIATVVDHIKPHKGDEVLFWDMRNWQSLCETHHNASKQREEKSGHEIGSNVDGMPVDPSHHWNK